MAQLRMAQLRMAQLRMAQIARVAQIVCGVVRRRRTLGTKEALAMKMRMARTMMMTTMELARRRASETAGWSGRTTARRLAMAALLGGLAGLAAALPARAQQAQAQRAPYTIRDIFSTPGLTGYYPENVEWSPDGSRITFLEHHEGSELADLYEFDVKTGKRAVMVAGDILAGAAEPPNKIKNERERERRTRYGVSSYHWSPKGDAILYSGGEQLYLWDVKTQQRRAITSEPGDKRDPKLSPDERWVSYVTDGDLRVVPLAGGAPRPVAPHEDQILHGDMDWVYPEELTLRTGYEWAPDSSRIAYMQFDEHPVPNVPIEDFIPHIPTVDYEKYPKAGDPNPLVSMVIYDVANGRSVHVPLAGTPDTYLARVGWLPNGSAAYAIVLDRAQQHEQIYLVDPRSGKPRLLLAEQNPWWIDLTPASFGQDDFAFFKNSDRFLFGSDRDGWRHLYLYDLKGRLIRQVTSGAWHDHFVALDEQGGWVYYTASERTPLENDLYRAPLSGGAAQRVTLENGNHSISMSPDNVSYIDTYSTATQPPSLTLRRVDSGNSFVIQAAKDVSGYGLRAPQYFTITAADGHTKLWAEMLKPPDFDPSRKYPVIMNQYGGPAAQTVYNSWSSGAFFDELLARDGFVLFEVDNRATSYFSRQQQALIKGHFGRIELADQLAAVQWLKMQPWVDGSRIGIWGWSFGGYMTTYELTNAPGTWRAGIAVAPVTLWTDYDSIYTERYMGMPSENESGYAESSSVTYAANLKDHLLLVHGTGDDNVHFQNTVQFIQALLDNGKQFRLMIYPRKTHGIGGVNDRTHLFTMMEDFWKQELGAGR